VNAKSSRNIERAANRLLEEKIKAIKISQIPFKGDIEETKNNMLDLGETLDK